jgi:NitT/TauT family transport system substrate-binding protein
MQPTNKILNIPPVGLILIFIILLAVLAVVFFPLSPSPPVPKEPLTIASGTLDSSVLTLVANEKGYFSEQGLNVTTRVYPAGAYAMKELVSGNADFAYASEFAGVSNSFQYPDLRIIAITAKSDAIELVARNDRGITKPSDLKGKTIAFTNGTSAEFFFSRYLTQNGMDINDITVRHLGPADTVKSVVSGDSDAAVVWNPYEYQIEQQLSWNVAVWSVQGGQEYYWITYTRADIIRTRPEMIRRYLRALDDAEIFVTSHQPEAKKILGQRLNMTDEYIDYSWGKNRFMLSLDQGLIIAMEDEARWMAGKNMTGGKAPPSYLDMIYQDAMREVKPSAVTVIR